MTEIFFMTEIFKLNINLKVSEIYVTLTSLIKYVTPGSFLTPQEKYMSVSKQACHDMSKGTNIMKNIKNTFCIRLFSFMLNIHGHGFFVRRSTPDTGKYFTFLP